MSKRWFLVVALIAAVINAVAEFLFHLNALTFLVVFIVAFTPSYALILFWASHVYPPVFRSSDTSTPLHVKRLAA